MKFNKKEQGFSLLEVMIALAVVSFLSFIILQLVFTNLKATKAVEVTASLDNLLMEVNVALKDPAVCRSNLANFSTTTLPSPLNTGSINLSRITSPSATAPLARTNRPLANQPATRLFLSIGNIRPISTTSYLANINFSLDKGQSAIGAREIVRSLPINLTLTSAGGPITGCNTFAPSTAATPSPAGSIDPAQICAVIGKPLDPKTNRCSGGPDTNLSAICASVGGTYDAGTQTCSGVGVVSGGANPAPTATPKVFCRPGVTECANKTWAVPELEVGALPYVKDWIEVINGENMKCHIYVGCDSSAKWFASHCTCKPAE
ncbi:type II secretion system protein [Bdellovibrio sp. HCB337]|uniref:type II secretion system protein n=1 Tax=Bdellovibrio sp. HCB337 TaxID=3394358 RepID=UPI0039A6AB62